MSENENKFTKTGTHLGFVSIPSGCVGVGDAIWLENKPESTDETYTLDLEADNTKVPVMGLLSNGKRYLMLAIDDCVKLEVSTTVEVEGKVELAEEETVQPEKEPANG